jgi:DNA-binding transcriptional regulator YhcF (GntR family)
MTVKQPDWEAIERAYRAGLLSVRAIGESHGVNHATILKRAKKEDWKRDLTDQVRAATKQKVTTAVTSKGNQSKVVTDAEIIDEASDQAAAVILAHRVGLAQWRGIADKLSEVLSDMEVTADNAGDFARSLNAGVDAQLKVIKGERQAYNLDTEAGDKTVSDLAALMDDLSKEA